MQDQSQVYSSNNIDLLSVEGINDFLKDPVRFSIRVFEVVTSTNALLKEAAKAGADSGTVYVANSQEEGRGRLGRNFFSPPGTGVYFSLLFRTENPQIAIRELPAVAAVAAAKAMDRCFDIRSEIKWVNDIYLGGKKIAGILCEGETDPRTQRLKYMIIGVGVNVYQPQGDFPAEIRERAGFLLTSEQPEIRNRLVAEFLNAWDEYRSPLKKQETLEIFRAKNFLQNKTVEILWQKEKRLVTVLDIDDHFALVARDRDGLVHKMNHGEATLHRKI